MKKLSKKAIYIIVSVIVVIGIITFIVRGKPILKPTLPEITFGNVNILVGKTTIEDLHRAGLEIVVKTDNSYNTYDENMYYELEKNTWTPNTSLRKGGHNYATLVLVNSSNKNQKIGKSVIYEINFSRLYDLKDELKINGIEILKLNKEQLQKEFEPMGAMVSDTGVFYDDGKYEIKMQMENNEINKITVTCKFNKKI